MRVLTHYLMWSCGLAQSATQTSAAERACLRRHAAGRRQLVEVGVWHGVTTAALVRALDPAGVIYAVDPYPPGRLGISLPQLIARRELARVEKGNVQWLRMTGVEAAQYIKDNCTSQLDFVFIDGDHSYESLRGDWEGFSALVAAGGIVALHDSRSSADRQIDDAGSVRFTKDVIIKDARFHAVEQVDTLTVLRRNDVP